MPPITVLLVLAIVGGLLLRDDTSTVRWVDHVTASQLYHARETNNLVFDRAYRDKFLMVSGTVAQVDESAGVIRLEVAGSPGLVVLRRFGFKDLQRAHVGQSVATVCEVTGYKFSYAVRRLFLNNCEGVIAYSPLPHPYR